MKSKCFLSAFLVLFTFANLLEARPSEKSHVEKKALRNDPWVLWDGKLRLNFQERVRGEIRDNNFDFDSSRNAVTDDLFLLQRFRLGITAQPAEGMTWMFEGQDSREFGSKRPNIPGVLGAEGDDEFDLRQDAVRSRPACVSPVAGGLEGNRKDLDRRHAAGDT